MIIIRRSEGVMERESGVEYPSFFPIFDYDLNQQGDYKREREGGRGRT
jgi:hypothetical protein